jgi:hypothetical protein
MMPYQCTCRYCSKNYTARNRTHTATCGSDACFKLHNNARSQRGRRERDGKPRQQQYTFNGDGNLVDQFGEVHLKSSFEDRFWSKTERRIGECWLWKSWVNKETGYGMFTIRYQKFLAHRIAYGLTHGSVPRELQLDHLCRNRSCINPTHLEPVTNRENMARGIGPAVTRARAAERRATRTECKNGHPWVPENIYVMGGHQVCRACSLITVKKSYEKKGAERVAAGLTKTKWTPKPFTPEQLDRKRAAGRKWAAKNLAARKAAR